MTGTAERSTVIVFIRGKPESQSVNMSRPRHDRDRHARATTPLHATPSSPLPLISGQTEDTASAITKPRPTLSLSSPSMHGRDRAVEHGWYCHFKAAVRLSAK